MMSRLLVIGAGGHGKVVAEAALASGAWDDIAFLDGRHPDLARTLELGPVGVYWAIAIAYSLSAVIGVLLFRRGKWKEKEV